MKLIAPLPLFYLYTFKNDCKDGDNYGNIAIFASGFREIDQVI